MDRKEKVTFSLSGKDLEAVEKNAAVCGFPLSKYCKTIAIRGYIPEVDLPLESEVEKQPEYLTMQGVNDPPPQTSTDVRRWVVDEGTRIRKNGMGSRNGLLLTISSTKENVS